MMAAGLPQQLHERPCAAIAERDLRPVHLDPHIADARSPQRGHQVLDIVSGQHLPTSVRSNSRPSPHAAAFTATVTGRPLCTPVAVKERVQATVFLAHGVGDIRYQLGQPLGDVRVVDDP